PKIAYQKGRHKSLRDLSEVLDTLIKNVSNDQTLKGFKEFFEAIVAYHKAYGGK
ncbi:MAG: type III-A CRISPR-associated protein Csm2, partial [Candidatus Lokiarchaeota archaeon]|nr:type III-A CRISPR-associated protein Csm2 [Candidatus Lokiarchaeota archaeon]